MAERPAMNMRPEQLTPSSHSSPGTHVQKVPLPRLTNPALKGREAAYRRWCTDHS